MGPNVSRGEQHLYNGIEDMARSTPQPHLSSIMAAAALTLLLSLASAVAEPVPSAPSLVRRAEAETFA